MKRILAIAASALLISGASAQQTSKWYNIAAPETASISVNTAGSGVTIPADFVGISTEVGDFVTSGYYQGNSGLWNGNASASSFIGVMNLLGSAGSFRIGGNSSDTATPPALTPTMATNLNTFLTALGANWKLIYGLDLVAANSTTAATQAGYIVGAISPSKVVFQFGNEPGSNGFSISTYQTAWNGYYTAVSAAAPGAGYAAIDDQASRTTWVSGLTPGMAGMQFFTFHYYNPPGCQPIYVMLNTQLNQASQFASAQSNSSTSIQGGARITEGGTNSSGGCDGVSNVMAGATWAVLQGIMVAPLGFRGINPHTRYTAAAFGTAFYNPIVQKANGNFTAGAEFYGLYLLSRVAGQQVLPSTLTGAPYVQAMATKGANGNANILVVNTNTEKNVNFFPGQSSAWSTATVLAMTSASGCSDPTILLGGASIGESGAWSGAATTISNGSPVTLGPCGAALIQIQP